jgi:hypothetical protein
MSGAPHLVSAGRSHPCVPPLAAGATQHIAVGGRCTRCGTTVDAAAPAGQRGRGLWMGERALAIAIGSGALALGVAYLLIATERIREAGASLLSAPAVVGAGFVALGGVLIARAVRG